MSRLHRNSGFTIVELVVTLTVTVVLFALVFQALEGLIKLSNTTLAVGRLEEAGGRVASIVASELRWADPETLLITNENGSTRVDCQLAEGYDGTSTIWSTPVIFRYEPSLADTNENGVVDEGSIVRIQDGSTRTLCRNIALGGLAVEIDSGTVGVQVTVFTETRQGQLIQSTNGSSAFLLNRSHW